LKLFNRKAKDSEELQDQEYDASDEDDSEVEDDTEEYSDEEDSDSGDEEFDEEGSDGDDEFDEEDSNSGNEYSDEDEEDANGDDSYEYASDEDSSDETAEDDERKENKLLSLFKSEQDTVYYVLTGIFLAVIVIAIIVLVKNAHTSSAPATPEQVAESQIAAYESEQPGETEISINHAGLDNYTEPSNASTGDAADVSSDAAGSESAASDGSDQNAANSGSTSDQDAANANGGTAVADTDTSEAADTKESESAETEALAASGDYVIPDSDTKEYTEDDIRALGLSKDELRIARNEIYARHGREFTSKDLKEYFGAKSWYNPTIPASKFSDNDLTPTELHNKEAIAKVEKSME